MHRQKHGILLDGRRHPPQASTVQRTGRVLTVPTVLVGAVLMGILAMRCVGKTSCVALPSRRVRFVASRPSLKAW